MTTAPTDTSPCTCILGFVTETEVKRFPIFDPFCHREEVHRELAEFDYEPKYPSKNGYDPMFINTEKETA